MTVPVCKRCGRSDKIKLRRQYAASGAEQFMWFCTRCEHVADSKRPFVSKKLIEGWVKSGKLPSIEAIKVQNDYRNLVSCDVCGKDGAEYHHWMPQAFNEIIEDAHMWPTAYLCKRCHDRWHETVTPYLPGRGKSKYADYTKDKYILINQRVTT